MTTRMTPEQWARVTMLFEDVRAQPPSARDAWLAQACPDDEVVRQEVSSLLAADREDDFLERQVPLTLGPYRIERLLARGGMGLIYLAHDARLSRRVTLKVLPASAANDPTARARLQREARTAASLRHPHIVSVHALEEVGPWLLIVAEYVEGPTLAEVISEEGPLSRARWLEVARALADALAAAHDAQVIHRDVKSSNVVLGRDGVRLVDFGIALAGLDTEARVTRTGTLAGTPLAMAPEQLEGAPASPASDQFAYGLVLYEAASGRLPFDDETIAAVWARLLRDDVPPLDAFAPELTAADVALVHRCLSRRPEDRLASMHAVLDAVRSLEAGRVADLVAPTRSTGASSAASPATATTPPNGLAASSVAATTGPRWWDRHQAIVATLDAVLLWPGWLVAATLHGRTRIAAWLTLVGLATLAVALRLHLWFGERHYPAPMASSRRRLWPVLAGVEGAYAMVLAVFAWLAAETRIVPAAVTLGLVVCLLVAVWLIEPATRRAHFERA